MFTYVYAPNRHAWFRQRGFHLHKPLRPRYDRRITNYPKQLTAA